MAVQTAPFEHAITEPLDTPIDQEDTRPIAPRSDDAGGPDLRGIHDASSNDEVSWWDADDRQPPNLPERWVIPVDPYDSTLTASGTASTPKRTVGTLFSLRVTRAAVANVVLDEIPSKLVPSDEISALRCQVEQMREVALTGGDDMELVRLLAQLDHVTAGKEPLDQVRSSIEQFASQFADTARADENILRGVDAGNVVRAIHLYNGSLEEVPLSIKLTLQALAPALLVDLTDKQRLEVLGLIMIGDQSAAGYFRPSVRTNEGEMTAANFAALVCGQGVDSLLFMERALLAETEQDMAARNRASSESDGIFAALGWANPRHIAGISHRALATFVGRVLG